MERRKSGESKNFKIETIRTPEGHEVSFCAERGGIIISIKFKGKDNKTREILHLDESALHKKEGSVRGGTPILFPNAGILKKKLYPLLKRHGFARDSKWKSTQGSRGFRETLESNKDTTAMFPHEFLLSIDAFFAKDGVFTIEQKVENKGETNLPLSMGLHPYFKVAHDQKKNIKFSSNGEEIKIIQKNLKTWANGGTLSIDNPGTPIEMEIPGLGTLVFEASPEYKKIWIWSEEGKDFFCVEPVMRDEGGLEDSPEEVEPGRTFSAYVKFYLKESKE